MARKKTALLMTVGTGVGATQDVVDSLAHGILYSIDSINPDLIIFFGSENSKKTIESLKKQYYDSFKEEFDYYEFIGIEEIDSFSKYFQGFKSKIIELENEYKIVIDYTSGTKTMTMAAGFASMLFRKKLVVISGKREHGAVVKGTEKINSQNLYLFYEEIILNKIHELFNMNRFESAISLIEDMVDNDEKEVYSKLLTAYSCFDNVNYEDALENFDITAFAKKWDNLKSQLYNNSTALNLLTKETSRTKHYYILASLINNAKRRKLEYNYDDAIARLYRSLELIAQIQLEKEYGLNNSDIDLEILENRSVDIDYLINLENKKSDGKIKLGLMDSFNLLYELNDDLGKHFKKNENKIRNVIIHRNNSILAHGLESKSEDEYNDFEEIVLDTAKVLKKDIDKYIEKTEFPKFDI